MKYSVPVIPHSAAEWSKSGILAGIKNKTMFPYVKTLITFSIYILIIFKGCSGTEAKQD